MSQMFLVLAIVLLPSASPGQTTCVPRAVGVPGMSGPPRWWNVDGDGAFPELPNNDATRPPELDRFADPRWNQAVGHSDGATDREHLQFRALVHQDTIYLSWEIALDPGGLNAGTDWLWIGIKQQNGKPTVLLQLSFSVPPAGDQLAEPRPTTMTTPMAVTVLTRPAPLGSSWAVAATPSWVTGTTGMTKLWTSWNGSPPGRWAFQVAVPKSATGLDAGLDFGADVQMWYSASVQITPAGVTPIVSAQYHWPRGRPAIGSGGENMPDPDTTWTSTFSLQATGCAADIALESQQIGTVAPPTSQIRFTLPPAANAITNTFFAKPRNVRAAGSADIPAISVSAKFYVANWGSQADRHDVSPAGTNTLWEEINPAGMTPNAEAITPGNVGATGIRTTWQLSKCEVYDHLPEATFPYPPECTGRSRRRAHSCVLVELFSGLPLVYANKSAYRNMDFVQASTFSRSAEVSVRHTKLPRPDAANLAVYLYVEALNLPRRAEDKTSPTAWLVLGQDSLLPGRGRTTRRDSIQIPGGSGLDRARVVENAALAGQLSTKQVDSLMPTYRVHAYREVDTSATIGGVRHIIVRPQSSFGYWVSHEGEVTGWRHELQGATLERLAPNFYKVTVPAGGVTEVTTIIEALVPRRFGLSIHGGATTPQGSLKSTSRSGIVVTADAELRIASRVSLQGLFGVNRFEDRVGGGDVDIKHASGGLKLYLTNTWLRPFVALGGGTYWVTNSDTELGAYGTAGLQLNVSGPLALDVAYTVHRAGSDLQFQTLQAGMLVRF